MADPARRARHNAVRRIDYSKHPERRATAAFKEGQRISKAKRRLLKYARVRALELAGAKRRKRRAEAELIALVHLAIPSSYPRDVRDDIAGEMYLALAERKLRRRDVADRVKEFISAYWKMHPRAGVVSLDAAAYPGGPTLIERLADPSIEMAAV
jgi:hypothetical protein